MASRKMEDYYLKGTANVAYSGTPVSDATEDDIKIAGLEDYQKKYSSSLKSDEWRKVLFLMSRGGRFEPVTTRRNGTQLKINSITVSECTMKKLLRV